jgi:hypothetical protein
MPAALKLLKGKKELNLYFFPFSIIACISIVSGDVVASLVLSFPNKIGKKSSFILLLFLLISILAISSTTSPRSPNPGHNPLFYKVILSHQSNRYPTENAFVNPSPLNTAKYPKNQQFTIQFH